MSIFNKVFLLDSVERAVKTFAQVLLALFLTGKTDVLTVNWKEALAAAGTAVLVSFLTSVLSAGVGDKESASLVVKPVEPQTGPAA